MIITRIIHMTVGAKGSVHYKKRCLINLIDHIFTRQSNNRDRAACHFRQVVSVTALPICFCIFTSVFKMKYLSYTSKKVRKNINSFNILIQSVSIHHSLFK